MINKAWSTLLNVSGNDLKYRQVPGAFLIDPNYTPCTTAPSVRFDSILYGDGLDPYYRVWKARSCLRFLHDCELIPQIEDGRYSYNMDDSSFLWNMDRNVVIPDDDYNVTLEVYGRFNTDLSKGILSRQWTLFLSNNTLVISSNIQEYDPQSFSIHWTGLHSQVIRLPLSSIDIRLYYPVLSTIPPQGAMDQVCQWTLRSTGKPKLNISSLYSDIASCGTDVMPVFKQALQDLNILNIWEQHPLVIARISAGLAAICKIRIIHG